MNKYLIDIFKEENTVILPGLGALTVVNRATNELMFMSFLKHNDGTLVKHIAQQEGIDPDLAKDKVEKYVEEIKAVLDNGGAFEISRIGVFSKDDAGEVQFSTSASTGTVESGVEQTIAETKQIVEEQIQEEIIPVIEKAVEEVVTPATATVQESFSDSEAKEEETTQISEEADIGDWRGPVEQEISSDSEKAAPVSEEEQWNDDLDLPPLNYQPERPKKPILEKAKKDKKPRKTGILWLILLALIVGGGAAYIGFNYNDLKEKIPFLASADNEESTDGEENIPEEIDDPEEFTDNEEIAEDDEAETIVQESLPEPEVKEVSVVSSNGLRFDKSLPVQVIVGSFGEESNATRLVEKLKSQGFPAEVLGVYGGLHTVSAASFSTMEEYKSSLSHLEGAGAHWVKK